MQIWFPLLLAFAPATPPDEFATKIRPILAQNCAPCHNNNILKAQSAADVEAKRGLFRNVAMQLRNRTMPPMASKITEDQRLTAATWIDTDLRKTACSGQDYAGSVTVRRLNRRDYRNTVRDLLGVDLDITDLFPEDGTGGEGFDTVGETLFVPPILMERYLQASQLILDRAIAVPPIKKSFGPADPRPWHIQAPADASYQVTITVQRDVTSKIETTLLVDGKPSGDLSFARYESKGTTGGSKAVTLARGPHTVDFAKKLGPLDIVRVVIDRKADPVSPEKRALHHRLFGQDPGEVPLEPRKSAERLLSSFAHQAYRRPLEPNEILPLMKLYDRAAERGDPYEARVKLALQAVLVSPKFLFRAEQAVPGPGTHPLKDSEIATRLSYFLWSTTPDAELSRLADEGRLKDPKILTAQLNRLLDDPRSRGFTNSFIGQWFGTKDVGSRVVPALNEFQDFYTPEIASDLRDQPILMFQYMLQENRPLTDFLNGNYAFLTNRLVRFYQLEKQLPAVGEDFQRVEWPDEKRGGVFGLAAFLAMTSHTKETSPVLRGAWVLDSLLGTAVPPPPPNVPPLAASLTKGEKLTVRAKLERHRADPSCATCHRLIDPIGFGLENFDWMGRWRDSENGKPVDASSTMPSGEHFTGPVELRALMMNRKDDFLRNVTSKVLGYALGRSLQDGDQCTVQRIVQTLAREHDGTRTLIREVVLSIPFRNSQNVTLETVAPAAKRPRTVALK